MILPGSYATALILLLLGMVGWGVWANTFKAAGGKWRFELFYFDFAIGVALAAVIFAFTAGSLGFDGFSFMDDLRLAGKRQDLFGFVAGIIFNLGNMLLLGAVSIAGMAVAFPIALGFALIVAACWNFSLTPGSNAVFLFGGVGVILAAIVFAILALKALSSARLSSAPVIEPVKGKSKSKKSKPSLKSVFLSLAGGLLLGSFSPLIQMGREGENGLGPYSIGFIFAIGVLFSTFVFNLFFMNLPVEGEPVDIALYFRAKWNRHSLGILGGILWYLGLIASLIGGRLEGTAQVAPPIIYVIGQGGIVIAVLCGLFLWREMDDADSSVKTRLGVMLLLLVAGIGLSAAGLAPAH
jgi:glucose uptake protein